MMKKRIELVKDIFEGSKHNSIVKTALYILLAIAMYLLLLFLVIPETYQLEEGQISPVTLYSPIKVVDEVETERIKTEAANKANEVYSVSYTIIDDQKNKLDNLFYEVSLVYEQINQNTNLDKEDKIKLFKELSVLAFLSDESIEYVAFLSDEKFKNLKYITITTLDVVMGTNIMLSELDRAYEKVEDLNLSNPYDDDLEIINLANEITNYFVKPNYFYDSAKTLQSREDAKNNIEPVYIKKDELIVSEGQTIDSRTYDQLKAVGLLKESTAIWPYFGLSLLILLLIFLLYYSIRRMNPALHQDNFQLLMLFIIMVLTFISVSLVGIVNESFLSPAMGYLAPIAFGVMLITALFSLRFAIISAVIFSIFASLVFNSDQTMIFDYKYGFVLLIGSIAGAFAMKNIKQRSSIFYAGVVVALFNLFSILVIILLSTQIYSTRDIIQMLSFGVINGIISSILMVGMLPFLESVFGVLSPIKLTELSNSNHPLLRKLLIETPGTYHHSIIVGNLAESAAEAIGANGLLARVGAYYHDVGKTKRPTFFVENQLNLENPHDKISPTLSKNIILAHTKDGVEMLKEYRLPGAIQDIVMQHHGTAVLKYFYNKALKESDEYIPESDYRYAGPKAQTKEAAIVGIADSVEAAVRSLSSTTNETIEDTVEKIIKDNLMDGQLNECDLTFKELEIISVSMLENLKGIFHPRIEYPDDKELEENKGAKI
ncbi:MAG: HD family phosphohydrolase [Vulcanibacillus sp.]